MLNQVISTSGAGQGREIPDLADILAHEAATAAWLRAHGVTDMTCDRPNHDERLIVVAPAPRLPLGTRVSVPCLRIADGVISGHSTCDRASYRVTWFDRRLWTIRHKWVTKGVIEVHGNKTAA